MLLRGRSRDRENKSSPPGPVYMSNKEFAEYLDNLRNNHVERPRGARPLSMTTRSEDTGKDNLNYSRELYQIKSNSPISNLTQRSNSAFSHKRAHSSQSTTHPSVRLHAQRHILKLNTQNQQISPLKPSEVVPSATYIERGQRWMEKEEAVALREAMEDMDLNAESDESRIYAAAQREASELVWQHKNPDSIDRTGQPYRYKNHLRKNSYQYARAESVGRYGNASQATGLARDIPTTLRSHSGRSSCSEDLTSRVRVSSDTSDSIRNRYTHMSVSTDGKRKVFTEPRKSDERKSMTRRYTKDIPKGSNTPTITRRHSGRRNVSGEIIISPFKGDQIWEEPEQDDIDRGYSQVVRDEPAPIDTKPKDLLGRVEVSQDSESRPDSTSSEQPKIVSNFEIHKNLQLQTRNSRYIANPPSSELSENNSEKPQRLQAQDKDGLEIRSDEIKQATSMRLKDRSPKLPTPSIVSDKPCRPIVSFDPNWKPKKADLKPESRRSPFDRSKLKQSLPSASIPKTNSNLTSSGFISIKPSGEMNCPNPSSTPNEKESPDSARLSSPENRTYSATSIPTINFSEMPKESNTNPNLPVINVETYECEQKRPLPIPKSLPAKSTSLNTSISRSHQTATFGTRTSIRCNKCELPIQNRVLRIGSDEHFHPECFTCSTCGTGLESLEIYPEPPSVRSERIEKSKRLAMGEFLSEEEGQTKLNDGDEKKRYYCYLDFHENFAPKCKHCKTPIIGEHIVALGEHWHYGHFFCAECGNPFEKDMTHIYKDGYAWCLSCQTKRTERQAPKCKKCLQSVLGEYIRALGGEWHEKCFRCNVCDRGFDDGSFYPKHVNDQKTIILCTQCIERELKA